MPLATARPCQQRAWQQEIDASVCYGGSRHYHLKRRYGIGCAPSSTSCVRQQGGGVRDLRASRRSASTSTTTTRPARSAGILCFNCNNALGQFRDRSTRCCRRRVPRRDRRSAAAVDELEWAASSAIGRARSSRCLGRGVRVDRTHGGCRGLVPHRGGTRQSLDAHRPGRERSRLERGQPGRGARRRRDVLPAPVRGALLAARRRLGALHRLGGRPRRTTGRARHRAGARARGPRGARRARARAAVAVAPGAGRTSPSSRTSPSPRA